MVGGGMSNSGVRSRVGIYDFFQLDFNLTFSLFSYLSQRAIDCYPIFYCMPLHSLHSCFLVRFCHIMLVCNFYFTSKTYISPSTTETLQDYAQNDELTVY